MRNCQYCEVDIGDRDVRAMFCSKACQRRARREALVWEFNEGVEGMSGMDEKWDRGVKAALELTELLGVPVRATFMNGGPVEVQMSVESAEWAVKVLQESVRLMGEASKVMGAVNTGTDEMSAIGMGLLADFPANEGVDA